MLSRMVSDMWQEVQVARNGDGDGDDQNEAAPLIFVDRNGDRFQYVLDYMRDGQKASLPFTVSKEGFLKDLEYYGFDDVDAKSITVGGIVALRCTRKRWSECANSTTNSREITRWPDSLTIVFCDSSIPDTLRFVLGIITRRAPLPSKSI
eukprot:jgi/Psemu1/328318/estExt_fgenesh1_pg.C_12020003